MSTELMSRRPEEVRVGGFSDLTTSCESLPSTSRWLVAPAVLLATSGPVTGTGISDVQNAVVEVLTSDGWAATERAESLHFVHRLKERSGLTWDEFARLFGVSRRAVHNWAAGGRMNARHSARFEEVAALLQVVEGAPNQVRERLMRPGPGGTSLYSHLVDQVAGAARPSPVHPLDLLDHSEVDAGVAGRPGDTHALRSRRA